MRLLFALYWISLLLTHRINAQVVINEFMPDPSSENDTDEWIELFNPTPDEVNLDGWQLDDDEGGSKPFTIRSDSIPGNGYLVYYKTTTNISLNNTGDKVRLLSHTGEIIDSVSYSSVKVDESHARIPNGSTTWVITSAVSPGGSNPSPTLHIDPTNTPLPSKEFLPRAKLILSEVYACPEKHELEWIELRIIEKGSIDDYLLVDSSAKQIPLSPITMENNQYLTREFTTSWLNNDGDEVILQTRSGEIIDRMSYSACVVGRSFVNNNQAWIETMTPTKQGANIVSTPSHTPAKPSPTSKTQPSPTPTSQTIETKSASPTPTRTLSVNTTIIPTNEAGSESGVMLPHILGIHTATQSESSISSELSITEHARFPWIMVGGVLCVLGGCWPWLKRIA